MFFNNILILAAVAMATKGAIQQKPVSRLLLTDDFVRDAKQQVSDDGGSTDTGSNRSSPTSTPRSDISIGDVQLALRKYAQEWYKKVNTLLRKGHAIREGTDILELNEDDWKQAKAQTASAVGEEVEDELIRNEISLLDYAIENYGEKVQGKFLYRTLKSTNLPSTYDIMSEGKENFIPSYHSTSSAIHVIDSSWPDTIIIYENPLRRLDIKDYAKLDGDTGFPAEREVLFRRGLYERIEKVTKRGDRGFNQEFKKAMKASKTESAEEYIKSFKENGYDAFNIIIQASLNPSPSRKK